MIHVVAAKTERPTQASRPRPRPFAPTGSTGRRTAVSMEDVRERAVRLEALVKELSGNGSTAGLRLEILRHLDQFGPGLVREIPHAWPVTRSHVRAMASRLIEEGLVAYVEAGDPGAPRALGLTEEGTRVLEEIDWNETIFLAEEEGPR
jgi:DNA-binding MarR family transcriptional regulator